MASEERGFPRQQSKLCIKFFHVLADVWEDGGVSSSACLHWANASFRTGPFFFRLLWELLEVWETTAGLYQ